MKTRKFIGGFIAIIGITAAVSVCDGSAHEMLVRGIGVALFAIGSRSCFIETTAILFSSLGFNLRCV